MTHLPYVIGAYAVFVLVLGADAIGSWLRLRVARGALPLAGSRVRFTLDVIKAIRARVGPDFILGVRGVADEGRTMIVVTHEMGFAREVADRVMFFDQGRIAHDAPPQEFFSNPANDRIRAFLGQVSH